METLTTHFLGICTHIEAPTFTDGSPHRCVLVNATNPPDGIAPHYAVLSMAADDIVPSATTLTLPPAVEGVIRMPLDRVKLTAENLEEDVNYTTTYTSCMPSLTTLAANLTTLSTTVVGAPVTSNAACYVDVHGGSFDVALHDAGAAFAILTQTFVGHPVLHVTGFESGGGTITFKAGATITVSNLPADRSDDDDADFVLHYLVFTTPPTSANPPSPCGVATVQTTQFFAQDNIGPGCSNSNYP